MTEFNNDKNVYLLGAGFSKEIGLPLQDDFLLVAKEVFFKNSRLFKHFEKVFEYQDKLTKMKKYLNYPLLNLEQLFNLIEMDIFYSSNDDVISIKKNFIRLICDVLIDKTPCPFHYNEKGNITIHERFKRYYEFIRLLIKDDKKNLKVHYDTIISLNYDLVIEGAACVYNWIRSQASKRWKDDFITLNTLFGKTNIVVEQVSQYFTKNRSDLYFPTYNLFSEDKNSIKLIKLHGSINWKTLSNNKTFIVPPTWNKSDSEIKRLWDKAYKELISAKRIIVIGYSFPETDIYVKSLLALALNENRILQNIYFINPDSDITKKYYFSLLDKYFEKYCDYKEWKYSEFINSSDGRKFIKDYLNREVTY